MTGWICASLPRYHQILLGKIWCKCGILRGVLRHTGRTTHSLVRCVSQMRRICLRFSSVIVLCAFAAGMVRASAGSQMTIQSICAWQNTLCMRSHSLFAGSANCPAIELGIFCNQQERYKAAGGAWLWIGRQLDFTINDWIMLQKIEFCVCYYCMAGGTLVK